MSRIGKKPIAVPDKTEVTVEDSLVRVVGPEGELTRTLPESIIAKVTDDDELGTVVIVEPRGGAEEAEKDRNIRALWGTYSSHIGNMIEGVGTPFQKDLVIEGVGYRAEQSGDTLVLHVGFSHPVELPVPDGITVNVEKNEVRVSGIDKEKVGRFASKIRQQRKPEPYKGKGIRYKDEVIRRKQGKKAVATTA